MQDMQDMRTYTERVYRTEHNMVLGDVELAGVFVILFVVCVAFSQALEHDTCQHHHCTQICSNADTPEQCSAIANLRHIRRRCTNRRHIETQTEPIHEEEIAL